jgi:hypothetical protein
MVAQILNFGLPAPINVQVQGLNTHANFEFASRLMNQMLTIPGLVDLHIQGPNTVPRLDIGVDRTRVRPSQNEKKQSAATPEAKHS